MIIYKKEQYDCIKNNIRTLDLNEISNASSIPLFRLYGILRTLAIPLDDADRKSFALRNCTFLNPKQISTITRLQLKDVYAVLHENGLRLDLVYDPPAPWNKKVIDKKREGFFNVHERENWLV